MRDIDMIKAFAKLEGFNQVEIRGRVQVSKGFNCDTVYNPITNIALNCAARDKYGVRVDYNHGFVGIYKEGYGDNGASEEFCEFSADIVDGDISKAVIECILKSKGKWEE